VIAQRTLPVRIANEKRDHEFIGSLSLLVGNRSASRKEYDSVLFSDFKKIPLSAKHFIKKVLAPFNSCLHAFGGQVIRTPASSTPAILGTIAENFATFSSGILTMKKWQ